MAKSKQAVNMNLAVLNPTRRRHIPGEMFVMLPPDGLYLFGRLIRTDANAGGFPNSNLIYIYRPRSTTKEPIPELRKEDLLIPPIMTNNLPWSKGYFEFLRHEPLRTEDVLRQHCFRSSGGKYFDEMGNQLRGPIEPVGLWGLDSYRTIDDAISQALGIPLAPEEP